MNTTTTAPIIETNFSEPHFSRSCGCNIPGGWEANLMNPDDFGVMQLYSGLYEDKSEAIADLRDQLACL